MSADAGILGRGEKFTDRLDAERGTFVERVGDWGGYHLITPFCQIKTRSRSLNNNVMIVEKNTAMMTSAP